MAQVTIYMDENTLKRMRAAADAAGLSMSAWLARLVADRTRQEWPADVAALAGAWRDMPSQDEIRRGDGTDAPREAL